MPEQDERLKTKPIQLHEREVTLADGRYLIYFTFDGGEDGTSEAGPQPPAAEPQSTEEGNV